MSHEREAGARKRRAGVSSWPRCILVLFLSGCQAVPARIATCNRAEVPASRYGIVARQVLVDSARETTRRPLRSVASTLSQPPLALLHASRGLLHKRLGLHLVGRPDPIECCRIPLDADALESELRRVAGDELQPAQIGIHLDGQEALDALTQAILRAEYRIDVIMYLWENDSLGWELARLLASKANAGVPVRVLIDGGGNLLQAEPGGASASEVNAVLCWLSRQPNVQVIRTRNPFFRFDHRKMVIVDGCFVWSGGRNFNRASFVEARDLSYTLTGPLGPELSRRYERFWNEQGGPPGTPIPPAPPLSDANTMARLVRTSPSEMSLARTVYTAVDAAKHHIYVENPYFTDNQLFSKLVEARRRGVDVRVVISLHTGSSLNDRANRVLANRLLQAGIRVYLYPGLLHVKALSVDGCWAYLGTGNFDSLSLRRNREIGVAISHGPLVGELESRLFQADFQPNWELTTPLPLTLPDLFAEIAASFV